MSDRKFIYFKYKGRCAYCGTELVEGWQIDHIVPKSRGGTNDIINLNPSCRACNNYKGGATLEEFRRQIDTLFNKSEYLFKSKAKMEVAISIGKMTLPIWDKVFYFEKVEQQMIEVTNEN